MRRREEREKLSEDRERRVLSVYWYGSTTGAALELAVMGWSRPRTVTER
jgi:hypothetical protein